MTRLVPRTIVLAVLLAATRATAQPVPEVRAGTHAAGGSTFARLFPIRSCARASEFFQEGPRTFGAFAISGSDDRGSVYTELVSDTGLCVVRFALGVTVAKGSGNAGADPAVSSEPTAEQKETLQRIIAGGGNAALSTAVPLVFLKPTTNDGETWLGVFALPKFGLDVPMLSTTTDPAALADLGVEASGLYTTDNRRFAFEGQLRASWMVMTSAYERNLGYDRDFGMVRGSAGVRIPGYFSVSVSFLVAAPREVKDIMPTVVVGVGTSGW